MKMKRSAMRLTPPETVSFPPLPTAPPVLQQCQRGCLTTLHPLLESGNPGSRIMRIMFKNNNRPPRSGNLLSNPSSLPEPNPGRFVKL